MSLFAPDLYRSFAVGFVGGALILGAVTIDDFAQFNPDFVPEAQAAEKLAPVNDDLDVAEEFTIIEADAMEAQR